MVAAQAGSGEVTWLGMTFTPPCWYAIWLLPSFLIFFVPRVGETNRAPFDLPEAESSWWRAT